MIDFHKFITYDDVKKRGYDLKIELNQGAFKTKDEMVDDFLSTCFNIIYQLIEERRGVKWTRLLFEDMSQDLTKESEEAQAYQEAIKYAVLEQTIFVKEMGDKEALNTLDPNTIEYSPKALRKLSAYGLLRL